MLGGSVGTFCLNPAHKEWCGCLCGLFCLCRWWYLFLGSVWTAVTLMITMKTLRWTETWHGHKLQLINGHPWKESQKLLNWLNRWSRNMGNGLRMDLTRIPQSNHIAQSIGQKDIMRPVWWNWSADLWNVVSLILQSQCWSRFAIRIRAAEWGRKSIAQQLDCNCKQDLQSMFHGKGNW